MGEAGLIERLEGLEAADADGVAVLAAVKRSDGAGLKVWCRHCRAWHLHGHGYGHREAHCRKAGSPYQGGGYILVTPAEAAICCIEAILGDVERSARGRAEAAQALTALVLDHPLLAEQGQDVEDWTLDRRRAGVMEAVGDFMANRGGH